MAQLSFIARSNLRDPFNIVYLPGGRFSHVGFRCVRSRVMLNDSTWAPTPTKDPGAQPPPPVQPRRRPRP